MAQPRANDRLHSKLRTAAHLALLLLAGCQPSASNAPIDPLIDNLPAEIHFTSGFDAGQATALAQQKPMMVLFVLPGCPHCRDLVVHALKDEQVIRSAQRFVCVLVDVDAEPQICSRLQVRAFPTVQFLTADGSPLAQVIGNQPPANMLAQMQAALQVLARRSFEKKLR